MRQPLSLYDHMATVLYVKTKVFLIEYTYTVHIIIIMVIIIW